MSHLQHKQNVHKPSGLEVYNDAAKILEELLEKHLDRNLQVPRKVRRNKTDPNSQTVVTNLSGSENALMRIQIKPYRHSKSLDENLSGKDLIFLKDKVSHKNGKNKQLNGSDSSIDTDDEQGHGSGKHKKKNLLKRAKERILQTFRRDQKESSARTKNRNSADSPSKKHPQKHKHLGESLNEAHSPKHAHMGNDTNTEHTEDGTHGGIGESAEYSARKEAFIASLKRNKNSASTGEGNSRSNDKHAHTFGSRKSCDARVQSGHDVRARDQKQSSEEVRLPSAQSSGTTNNVYPLHPLPYAVEQSKNIQMPTSVLKPELNSSILPPSGQSITHHQEHSKDKTSEASHLYPSSVPIFICEDMSAKHSHSRSRSPSSQRLNVATTEPGSITRATSGFSSDLLQPDSSNGVPGVTILYRANSNVLDSPGEDIEFMDIDNSVVTVRKSSSGGEDLAGVVQITDANFSGGEEFLGRPHGPPGGVRSGGPEVVHFDVVAQGDCDDTRATSAVPSIHTVSDSPQASSLGGQAAAQVVQSSADREALYGKIAQKLIEMGDLYSTSASDQEAGEAAAVQPSALTDLENDIITCLRAGGDRYSKQFDESFKEVTEQTVQETYQRFHSTVTNSMGSELSWNHVAFLFYTTKGVVSAVGQGSRTAKQVKEFTLQYITDTFASWIINQGGFDSVLSSEESDFDVD